MIKKQKAHEKQSNIKQTHSPDFAWACWTREEKIMASQTVSSVWRNRESLWRERWEQRLTMENPLSLFRVLGGNSDILFIVWRSYLWQQNSEFSSRVCLFARVGNLDSAAAEHALDTDADGHDAHSRTPIFVQDRETDVAVAVDVRVAR